MKMEIIKQMNPRQAREASSCAKTMLQQIKAVGWSTFSSWGTHSIQYGMALKERMQCPFVQFLVSGFIHKGLVRVFYLPVPDVYMVQLLKKKKGENGRMHWVEVKQIEEVYCDTLGTTIDENVETTNDKSELYGKQVTKFLKETKI
jgi:hypothetical protein